MQRRPLLAGPDFFLVLNEKHEITRAPEKNSRRSSPLIRVNRHSPSVNAALFSKEGNHRIMRDVQQDKSGTAIVGPAVADTTVPAVEAPAPQAVAAPSMKAAALKGMPVVSIADSTRLGIADDVLFDIAHLRIGVLRIEAGGQKVLVPFDQVRSLGNDAITVASNQLAEWAGATSEVGVFQSTHDLTKRKVVDEAGTVIGMVQDVEFDSGDGRITQLKVHKGGMLGVGGETAVLPAGDVISIGDEFMVVRVSVPSA